MTESGVRVKRRTLLRRFGLGAAAVGAAAVGGVTLARPASAADGDPLLIGEANHATSNTSLISTGPGYALFARILSLGTAVGAESQDGDGVHGTSYKPAAAAVRASGRAGAHGVIASAEEGGIGGVFEGKTAPMRLVPQLVAGAPTTESHQRGELLVDVDGLLLYCTTSGTPGTWKRVKLGKL